MVKGSPSAGPVLAAHGSVHRAHTWGGFNSQQVPPMHPGVNQGADRTGRCIGHTEWSIKEFVHSSEKTGKPPLKASCHLLCAHKSIFNSYDTSYSESA